MRESRKKVWIDREIQLRFVIYTILILGICCLIVSTYSFYSLWNGLITTGTIGRELEDVYSISMKKFVFLNVSLILIMAFLASLGMILLSHKVAGPAYRIRKALKELQEGKEVSFKLRRGDALNPLAEEVEKFAEEYKELRNSAIRVIEMWKKTEVKDISLNLALKDLENKIMNVFPAKKGGDNEKGI